MCLSQGDSLRLWVCVERVYPEETTAICEFVEPVCPEATASTCELCRTRSSWGDWCHIWELRRMCLLQGDSRHLWVVQNAFVLHLWNCIFYIIIIQNWLYYHRIFKSTRRFFNISAIMALFSSFSSSCRVENFPKTQAEAWYLPSCSL